MRRRKKEKRYRAVELKRRANREGEERMRKKCNQRHREFFFYLKKKGRNWGKRRAESEIRGDKEKSRIDNYKKKCR